jgi:hypothetical protein
MLTAMESDLNFLLLARGEAVASPGRARIPCGGAMLKLRRVAAFGAAHKLDGASFPASSCLSRLLSMSPKQFQ